MADAEQTLRAAYAAFDARDLDAAIALLHPDVDWANGWEGGRVRGRAAVREYWQRQLAETRVRHRYRLEEGLVARMDILDP